MCIFKKNLTKHLISFYFIILFILSPLYANAIIIKEVSPKAFEQIIDGGNEDVKFVFVFTSWCNVCKSMFSQILQLYEQYKSNDRVKIIMLSMDDKLKMLEAFAQKFDNKNAIVYSTSNLKREEILSLLRNHRIGFKGRIPHMTIFYKGAVIGDDIYEIQSVRELINYAISQN